jgi:hypothetical protein
VIWRSACCLSDDFDDGVATAAATEAATVGHKQEEVTTAARVRVIQPTEHIRHSVVLLLYSC